MSGLRRVSIARKDGHAIVLTEVWPLIVGQLEFKQS
jgi:hypothetical protein